MNKPQHIAALIALSLSAAAFSPSVTAQQMASDNYGIAWATFDAGGAQAMSDNYGLEGSIGQSSALGTSAGANTTLTAGFYAAPDSDADQVRDFMDNCTLDINTSQYDSNGDGFGNRCDPDLDNSGVVNFADYALLTAAFLSAPGDINWNPDADLTGDNLVNFIDISLFQVFFLATPGPSGIN